MKWDEEEKKVFLISFAWTGWALAIFFLFACLYFYDLSYILNRTNTELNQKLDDLQVQTSQLAVDVEMLND